MPRRCTTPPARITGFTLPELLGVIVITSVLAVFAMPSLDGVFGFRDEAWRSELIAALRNARQTAVAHRRLVCVGIGTSGVSLQIAATNPAAACTHPLVGPDGQTTYATGSGTATTLSPAGTLYFQPSGRATTDAAGTTSSTWQIAITGQPRITLLGETGHVE
jgi:prepilin-type N-terminal cleavage/methylation domain-containing protein